MHRSVKIDWHHLARPRAPRTPYPEPERSLPDLAEINIETLTALLERMKLVGMGGGGFSSAAKVRAAAGARTLVINAVACEPGVTIDTAVLLHHAKWVAAGARAVAQAIGADRVTLAVKKSAASSAEIRALYPDFELARLSANYPAGAETLILEKITGRAPAPGVRPHELGFLVQNVVTLRAVGRALLDGVAAVERPLTLAKPSTEQYENLIVPVGVSVGALLRKRGFEHDPSRHVISAGGLMMGRMVGRTHRVDSTTFSIFILHRDAVWREERPCVRCGACDAACPLGLNPFLLAERARKGKTAGAAFKAQMTECFLCGACAAVCPSDVPLVPRLERGKACL